MVVLKMSWCTLVLGWGRGWRRRDQRLKVVCGNNARGYLSLCIGLFEDLFGRLRCRYGWRNFEWGRVGRE